VRTSVKTRLCSTIQPNHNTNQREIKGFKADAVSKSFARGPWGRAKCFTLSKQRFHDSRTGQNHSTSPQESVQIDQERDIDGCASACALGQTKNGTLSQDRRRTRKPRATRYRNPRTAWNRVEFELL